MDNRPKPKAMIELATPAESILNRETVTDMIGDLMRVLEDRGADPNEGVLSLLTAFIQGAGRVLDVSTLEQAEHNREALLSMVEHARRTIDAWPLQASVSDRVH
jgi:hypothetical protein